MKIEDVAQKLVAGNKNITLIFAFNGTGKTRLSVAFKDATKAKNGGNHAGVYYNAYSEDLFYWDNDDENDGTDIRLCIRKSSLNRYHASLDEENLRKKLSPYNPIMISSSIFMAIRPTAWSRFNFFWQAKGRHPTALKFPEGKSRFLSGASF